MKSIILEASSIAKAIEEGWVKAQKPKQFTVKVLEDSEKNFFGLTKKSAKVAILFDEPQPVRAEQRSTPPQKMSTAGQPTAGRQHDRQQIAQRTDHGRPQHTQRAAQPPKHQNPESPAQPKKQFEPLWSSAMVERTQQWMHDALKNSGNDSIKFNVEPQKFHMRITLSAPILSDSDKEKQLLASFSVLILETLKRSFKLSLRGHKIVLTHKND